METLPVVDLPKSVNVVNIGLPLFETALRNQGLAVTGVDWRLPWWRREKWWRPWPGQADGAEIRKSAKIDRANVEVVSRLDRGAPMLKAVDRAGSVVPGMGERTVLHCGPAIAWADMCAPLQRSIKPAIVTEGWPGDTQAAGRLAAAGEVELQPATEHSAAAPMATSIGPAAPVYVVENASITAITRGSCQVSMFTVEFLIHTLLQL